MLQIRGSLNTLRLSALIMNDSAYIVMMEALAVKDTTVCLVPQSLPFFVRYGPVPYVNGGIIAAALGIRLDELKTYCPRAAKYGTTLLEYDDLWDDLELLAHFGHPGAARLWLTLYRDHGMPLITW